MLVVEAVASSLSGPTLQHTQDSLQGVVRLLGGQHPLPGLMVLHMQAPPAPPWQRRRWKAHPRSAEAVHVMLCALHHIT